MTMPLGDCATLQPSKRSEIVPRPVALFYWASTTCFPTRKGHTDVLAGPQRNRPIGRLLMYRWVLVALADVMSQVIGSWMSERNTVTVLHGAGGY
ncbi:unnamed protein product [Clonostachys rhizophaga]|uniref:Uncharacterized protein n=1 Tax=Clonostachys rhizophaga TaxID=160324 RepID=A0A9N9VU16_9HYPO|nr:unnamed protein product [Clonostachys rhizophaga]